MTLPNRRDFVPVDDNLDAESACGNFLGKTLKEAEEFIRKSSPNSAGDLMWMGPVAFRYYIDAAISYIKSECATGDGDFIAQLATALEHRRRYDSPEE